MLIAKAKSLKNALHSTMVFQNCNIMKIGKSNETSIKNEKAKISAADFDPQNNLECQTMKTRVYVMVAELIDEQEILGFSQDLFSIVSKNILLI